MAVALGEKKLFLLDMDGTIYLDDDLFPGTVPFLEAVRARGGRYLFLTNNSSRSRGDYVSKLRRLGVAAEEGDFLTSVDALVAHLEGRAPYRLCYAFGTAWYMAVYTRSNGAVALGTVLGWCVVPYIIPDLAKIGLAVGLSNRLQKHIR